MPVAHVCCIFLVAVALAFPAMAEPTQLTQGAGKDTEAAWSPDGGRVVFQRELGGDVDLCVVDLATEDVTPLVGGAGHACHPAWSPDGKWIVYSFAHFTGTAAQGIDNGYNLFVVPASGGEPRRLTGGLARDYTPTFSPDGEQVYFSSTRGATTSSVGLFRMPLEGGAPEPVITRDASDTALVQPDLSPDGRLICCGYLAGFRSNWTLRLIKPGAHDEEYPLTDPDAPMYGPRWSPDGKLIACTGFRPGDPGWGVYLVEAATGRRIRLETGPGNSRSPAWSPDGKELVFESDRTGVYKLYRLDLPAVSFPEQHQERGPDEGPAEPVVALSFAGEPGDTVRDRTGHGNHGNVVGEVAWRDGGAAFGQGQYLTIPQPRGCDFGEGAFSVKLTVSVEEHTNTLRLIAVGDYPEHRQGWQVYLNEENCAYFNSRAVDGLFVGARSDGPLPVGRRVTIIGIRRGSGRVELYVDGLRQHHSPLGASMPYSTPNQIRLGTQFNGAAPFVGAIHDFEVYAGALGRSETRGDSLREFLSR
jgi:sugar lactone lactonase YvrE